MSDPAPVSQLFREHLDRLVATLGEAPLADLACGRGRHSLPAARRGLRVIGLDRSAERLAELAALSRRERLWLAPLRADLESGSGIPLRAASCGAVLVFRYLHRPLARAIADLLRPGGLLLYETFTRDQPALGYGPRNPAYLLEPGELPSLFPELEILHSWEGRTQAPSPAALARLVARRP